MPSKKPITVKMKARIELRLDRVRQAIERARKGNLAAVGFLVSSKAKSFIKRSRSASQPGTPPTTRRGRIRRAIRYRNEWRAGYIVIGPIASMVGTSGEAHEFGGRYKRQVYPARPFMGPALMDVLPQIGPKFKGSVGP